MPISVFRRLCPAVFDFTGKAVEKFDFDWTKLIAYGSATIKQIGVRVIKDIWNNKKWNLIFHIVDVQGLLLLGFRTLGQMGILKKHPMVCV